MLNSKLSFDIIKFIYITLICTLISLNLSAQKWHPPPATLKINDTLFVDATCIDVDSWYIYLEETKKIHKKDLEVYYKKYKRKHYKKNISNVSYQGIDSFCVWRNNFVNKFKDLGTTNEPHCPANEIYKRIKDTDINSKYKIIYRLPNSKDILLIIDKLKKDKRFRRMYKKSRVNEILQNDLILSKGQIIALDKEVYTFRCMAEYIKK